LTKVSKGNILSINILSKGAAAMPEAATLDRVTLHLKTDRHVRDRLLGSLRAEGITMQDFFENFMHLLVTQPERFKEVKQWTADVSMPPRKAPGRPARELATATP
jgi:hypothetical protein